MSFVRLRAPRQTDLLMWAVVLLCCALLSVIPFAYMEWATGSWLPEILPQLESDSRYYLVQIREVLDGHPFLGNPYIRDYADASFPGLLLPIWIASIPGFLGLSMNALFAVNTVFYTLLTGSLLYLLCLQVTAGERLIAASATLLGLAAMHGLLIRPAILQTVYPALALFLLALYGVLEKPHAPRRYLWLGITNTIAFYLYPYLWMITFSATGFLALRTLWLRDKRAILLMAWTGLGIVISCLPQIFTVISLFSDPLGQQLNARVGVVETHRVLPLTVFNHKYILLTVAGYLLLRLWRRWTTPELFVVLLNAGILAVAFSNVITGKEIEFYSHPWWLSLLTTAVTLAVLAGTLRQQQSHTQTAVISVMLLMVLGTTTARIIRLSSFPYLSSPMPEYHRSIQEFARVFDVLDKNNIHRSVLLVPPELATYVPIYTDNYVFYMHRIWLHMMPDDEVYERFLVAYVDQIDDAFVREQFDGFTGYSFVQRAKYMSAFGEDVQPIDLAGGDAFVQKVLERHRDISADYTSYLRKYGVTHVVVDRQSAINPRVPDGATVLHGNERFTVYRLSATD